MKMVLLLFLVVGFSFCAGMVFQGSETKPAARERARATGVGGIFFKSENPDKLTAWYEQHLGIKLREGAQTGEPPMFEWRGKDHPETVGVTVWWLFPKDTNYFGSSRTSFMINYRVDDLDRLLHKLRESGVQVDGKISEEANGRFSWATDPEGNRLSFGNQSRAPSNSRLRTV